MQPMAGAAVTSYSLVIPVYRNEETLPDLLAAAARMHEELGGALEVVFVVDGSPDRSLPMLLESLPRGRLNAKVLEMSRNFGAFAAIRAGLIEASGPYFAVMAADLQEPPELALQFFRKLSADTCDVVIGIREGRDDTMHVRAASALFWGTYRRLVQPEMPAGGIDVFGCNRVARDQLVALSEAHSSLVGLLIWIGLRREEVRYRRLPRRPAGARGRCARSSPTCSTVACLSPTCRSGCCSQSACWRLRRRSSTAASWCSRTRPA